MTANAFASDVRAAFESGMDAHLAKPIDLDRIKNIVENFTQILHNVHNTFYNAHLEYT